MDRPRGLKSNYAPLCLRDGNARISRFAHTIDLYSFMLLTCLALSRELPFKGFNTLSPQKTTLEIQKYFERIHDTQRTVPDIPEGIYAFANCKPSRVSKISSEHGALALLDNSTATTTTISSDL